MEDGERTDRRQGRIIFKVEKSSVSTSRHRYQRLKVGDKRLECVLSDPSFYNNRCAMSGLIQLALLSMAVPCQVFALVLFPMLISSYSLNVLEDM